jgi:hypothetical protein
LKMLPGLRTVASAIRSFPHPFMSRRRCANARVAASLQRAE